MRAELRDEVIDDLGQQDPGGIPAVAGVRADEPSLAGDLLGPRGGGGPAGQVRERGVLDLGRPDAPRQEMVAVDDDIERAGIDRVDDRQAGRTLVEDRLGVAHVRDTSVSRSMSSTARPWVPTGRNAG